MYELVQQLAAALHSVVPKGLAGGSGSGSGSADGSHSGGTSSAIAAAAAAAAASGGVVAMAKPPPPPRMYWGNLLSQTSTQANVSLKGLVFSVGRGTRCQLQLRDPSVSCIVLRMSPLRGRVVIESHSNSTLTTIDSKPLTKGSRMWLPDGAEVAITTASARTYTYIFQSLLAPADGADPPAPAGGGVVLSSAPPAGAGVSVTSVEPPLLPPVAGAAAGVASPGGPLGPFSPLASTGELSADGKFFLVKFPLLEPPAKAAGADAAEVKSNVATATAAADLASAAAANAAAAAAAAMAAATSGAMASHELFSMGLPAAVSGDPPSAAAAAEMAKMEALARPPKPMSEEEAASLRAAARALVAELSATKGDLGESAGMARLVEMVKAMLGRQRAVGQPPAGGAPLQLPPPTPKTLSAPAGGAKAAGSLSAKAAAGGTHTPPPRGGAPATGAPAGAPSVDKAVGTDGDAMAVDTAVAAAEPNRSTSALGDAASPSTPSGAVPPVGGETTPPGKAAPHNAPPSIPDVLGTPPRAGGKAAGAVTPSDTAAGALLLGVPPVTGAAGGPLAVPAVGLADKATAALPTLKDDAALTADVRAAGKALFEKSLAAGADDAALSLSNFPYSHLNPELRDVLVHTAYLHLHHPDTARRVSDTLTSFRPRVLLVGPSGTETYQEKLVRALAGHLNASLAVVDLAALASESSSSVGGSSDDSADEMVETQEASAKEAGTPAAADSQTTSVFASGLDADVMHVDGGDAAAASRDALKQGALAATEGIKPSEAPVKKGDVGPAEAKDADVVMGTPAPADGAAASPAEEKPSAAPSVTTRSAAAAAPQVAEADAKGATPPVVASATPKPASASMPSRAKPPVPPVASSVPPALAKAAAAKGTAGAAGATAATAAKARASGGEEAAAPAAEADEAKAKEPSTEGGAAELSKSHKVNWAVPLDSEIPADKTPSSADGDRSVFKVGDRVRFVGSVSSNLLARSSSSLAYKRAERRLRNRHAATPGRRGGEGSPLPLLPPMPFLPPSLGDSAAGRSYVDDELHRALLLSSSAVGPGFLRPRSSVRVVGIGSLGGAAGPGGPAPGAVGRVALTFGVNTRVGVRFDAPVARGSNLGNRCEGTHGYFCRSVELESEAAPATGGPANAVPVSSISLLDAIIEAAGASLAVPDAPPLILYVRDAEQLVAGGEDADAMAARLQAALGKLPPRVLVLGSMTSTDAVRSAASGASRPAAAAGAFGDLARPSALAGLFFPRSGGSGTNLGTGGGRGDLSGMFNLNVLEQLTRMEERMDRGALAGAAAAGAGAAAAAAAAVPASVSLFPVRVPILPPLDEEKATAWRAEIDKDVAAGKRKVNQARLVEVLTSVNMECPDLDSVANEDISVDTLAPEAVERVVAFAASIQLQSNALSAKRQARRRARAAGAAAATPAAATPPAATPAAVAPAAGKAATDTGADASAAPHAAELPSDAAKVSTPTDATLEEVPLEPEVVQASLEAAAQSGSGPATSAAVISTSAGGDVPMATSEAPAAATPAASTTAPGAAQVVDGAAGLSGPAAVSPAPGPDVPKTDSVPPASTSLVAGDAGDGIKAAKEAVAGTAAAAPIAPKHPPLMLTAKAVAKGIRLFKSDRPDAEKAGRAASLRSVVTENDFEKRLLTDVVPAEELGVTFDSIGALDKVKETLHEIVMLPLQRPELFRRGNLAKPTKGVLLFGPPGTGKTMLAKAVATEAGANFMNVSLSSVASKWFGEGEKFVKAVFSLARKIAPSVIFIDEVDSMLGKRGEKRTEHEATRKMKNEFMSAWDGLRTRDSERVLVLGATNRPFDLDDAVLRRLPRRLLVDLPDAANRAKILRIITRDEELGPDVDLEALAALLQGYSGSDLRNLCIAAAYNPIREHLKAEKGGKATKGSAAAAKSDSAQAVASVNDTAKSATGGDLPGADAVVVVTDAPAPSAGSAATPDGYASSDDSSDDEDPLRSVMLIPDEVPTPSIRPLLQADFLKAKDEVSSSVSEDAVSIAELRKWGEEYGDGYGKGTKSKALTYFL